MQSVSLQRLGVCLASTFLLTTVCLAQGATLRNPEEAKELAEKVLARVIVGNMDGAFAVVKPYWPFPENELEELEAQAVQQRNLIANRIGKSIGFTLVRRELVSEIFLRLTYIEKLENTGLRWMFTFYKVKDAWKCHSLVWDDDIAKLFSSGN